MTVSWNFLMLFAFLSVSAALPHPPLKFVSFDPCNLWKTPEMGQRKMCCSKCPNKLKEINTINKKSLLS